MKKRTKAQSNIKVQQRNLIQSKKKKKKREEAYKATCNYKNSWIENNHRKTRKKIPL